MRYGELRSELSNITNAVLAATLKQLIRDEIVNRKSFDEVPPHVE
ncbi:MAG: winged helix-turn-helix transcriptional regulator [Desulfovibrio sp.]|nr:winged helix-turn-helix transcriptional regulator [Desulfovibrio sp.]